MNPDLTAFVWPASRFDDARTAVARESGLHVGLEALATEMSYADFERRLPTLGPALLQVPGENDLLAILANSTLLSPDQTKVKIDLAAVRSALCSEMEAPVLKQIQETLELAEVPVSRQARARAAILRERFSAAPIPKVVGSSEAILPFHFGFSRSQNELNSAGFTCWARFYCTCPDWEFATKAKMYRFSGSM
jgi:hypothetical protein